MKDLEHDGGNRNAVTDPSHATAAELNRKSFIGLSVVAAAATAAATPTPKIQLGRIHAALAAEDDPKIEVSRVELKHDGRTVPAYHAAPRNGSDAVPGIVMVQHVWGVDAQIRDVVRRLAKNGYATIAPELYAGLGAPSGDEATDFAPFRA